MIKAVLFDVGGTLHTVTNNDGLRTAFARRLIDRLAVYDILIDMSPVELGALLHENAEEYKRWSQESLCELPGPRIWDEYYLAQFKIGRERLAPIAEELSFLYDYERVCNKRRPNMLQAIEELHKAEIRMGIISNIISTSFVPHILREYGIAQYMECVVLSSEAGCRKPDARIFDLAMDQLGLGADEVAYVGDTISRDVLGAKNAGLAMMIQIRNPVIAHRDAAFRENAPKPDSLIEDLGEIPRIIRDYNAECAEKPKRFVSIAPSNQ